jgi:hypothetical protein
MKDKLEKEFKKLMNEALEGVNGDGSVIGCNVDMDKKKVFFEFELVDNDGEYCFFGW